MATFGTPLPRNPGWIYLLLAVGLAANGAGLFGIGILPDEAYYWVWSERLQAGYFDHPPLVAWLMRPFTALFGDSTWAVRLPAVLAWLTGAWVAYEMGSHLYGSRRAGLLGVLIWTSLPIVQIGFHIVTPDAPLIIFAWLAFYFALKALERPGPLWIAAGLCAGLATAGKYPGVLVGVGLWLGLLLTLEGRRHLATRWPWLGLVAGVVAFAPVVWWNYQREWVSFAFQLGHGVRHELSDPWNLLGIFIGGQLAAVMPWTWLGMAWCSLSRRANSPGAAQLLLIVGFWLPLLLFGIAGLTTKGHVNWPVAAYVPGTLLLAGPLERWLYGERGGRPGRIAFVVGVYLLVVAVMTLLRFPFWWQKFGNGITAERTQLSQTYGWDRVMETMEPLLREAEAANPAGGRCTILADSLQSAAMVAYFLDDPTRTSVNPDGRISQYRLWDEESPRPPGNACLYFAELDDRSQLPEALELGRYGHWKRVRLLELHNPDLSLRWAAFYFPDEMKH